MGGLVLYLVVSEVLETALVGATTDAARPISPATTPRATRPAILGAKLAYNSLTALWSGYMTAKVAGEREMYYGSMAAFVQTAELAWRFLMDENAGFTPVWMRAFLVLSTGPAMLLGASIRGRARAAQDEAVEPERREQRVIIAYQGEPGAYSEAAALRHGGPGTETLPCKSFDDVFDAVAGGHGLVRRRAARELDRRHDPPQLRSAGRARHPHHRRGGDSTWRTACRRCPAPPSPTCRSCTRTRRRWRSASAT